MAKKAANTKDKSKSVKKNNLSKKEVKEVKGKSKVIKAKAKKPVKKAIKTKIAKKTIKKVEGKSKIIKVKAKKSVKKAVKTKIAKKTVKKIESKPKLIKEEVKKTIKKVIIPRDKIQISTEKKLAALYALQQIDSEIAKIYTVRGELPLEVQDLEDEIAGLETRISNYKEEAESLNDDINNNLNKIKDYQLLINKYEKQRDNVRNNREYDSLSKEIEYQGLEIQLCEKKIKEYQFELKSKKQDIENSNLKFKERKNDLKIKKSDLKNIISETEKEEKKLVKQSDKQQKFIEERLLTAYKRIIKKARNGLAVVKIERDACGGCFNRIPPQRQLDIKTHKKIIVCEYCGRILVDDEIVEMAKI